MAYKQRLLDNSYQPDTSGTNAPYSSPAPSMTGQPPAGGNQTSGAQSKGGGGGGLPVQPAIEAGKAVGSGASTAGSWIGKGVGALGSLAGGIGGMFATNQGTFQQTPGQFQLPGFDYTQAISQQGMSNAMGGQAPNVNQSPENQFRNKELSLSNMLMAQARGGGPNPAAEQERQATNRNIAQAYALAQANPNNAASAQSLNAQTGMMNQQAASDSAIQRMNQQLAAQQQLGGLVGGARSQDIGLAENQAQLQQNQFGLNNQYGLGWAGLGQQANQQQLQAQIAQQQLAQQAYENQAQRQNQATGGLLNGVGGAISSFATGLFAHGGEVPRYASGGPVGLGYFGLTEPNPGQSGQTGRSPLNVSVSGLGSFLGKKGGGGAASSDSGATQDVTPAEPISSDYGATEDVTPAEPFKRGGFVPGQARVQGDSPKNDTVPARLSPGEIVLPRSVTQDPDAEEKAKQFVKAILAKHSGRKVA